MGSEDCQNIHYFYISSSSPPFPMIFVGTISNSSCAWLEFCLKGFGFVEGGELGFQFLLEDSFSFLLREAPPTAPHSFVSSNFSLFLPHHDSFFYTGPLYRKQSLYPILITAPKPPCLFRTYVLATFQKTLVSLVPEYYIL